MCLYGEMISVSEKTFRPARFRVDMKIRWTHHVYEARFCAEILVYRGFFHMNAVQLFILFSYQGEISLAEMFLHYSRDNFSLWTHLIYIYIYIYQNYYCKLCNDYVMGLCNKHTRVKHSQGIGPAPWRQPAPPNWIQIFTHRLNTTAKASTSGTRKAFKTTFITRL